MLFAVRASRDVKLGNRPKTVSMASHFKERLNSNVGALACSTLTVR
jgi:hypothetical protein